MLYVRTKVSNLKVLCKKRVIRKLYDIHPAINTLKVAFNIVKYLIRAKTAASGTRWGVAGTSL